MSFPVQPCFPTRVSSATSTYPVPSSLPSSSVVLIHLLAYFFDPYGFRSFPGPFLAKFSDAWLGMVHELHKKYGTFVRIAPNHLSIASPEALQVVYAHGNGAMKSLFYDAFVSIQRGLFNTRDRAQHSRKRKIISHIFSQKSVMEFEPSLRLYVRAAYSGESGTEGEGGWSGHDGRLWLDCLPWTNYLAFDIIGDLAFGASLRNEEGLAAIGQKTSCAVVEIPAVQILNDRGEFSMTMGVFPPWWRPIARKLPMFQVGGKAVKSLAGIAIMAVAKRLATPTDRTDLLSKLQAGKDEKGKPMGREELTAEALTLLIAGSDTTSNSTCAIIYYLARNPHVQAKLHKELDEQLNDSVSTADEVKNLPYLDACIDEGLRLHSTSALGLPRIVPEGGMTVHGHFFPEGAILSVPSYTIHRDPEVWGDDIEEYRPERWFERDNALIQKTFNPFSLGPRACVGRNLASLELQIIVSSILRRFHFVLEDPAAELPTREGFLRKPLKCRVGIKMRDVL
ncbi:cytochrome P450 [Armillaria borealis]|uniref:Cytochrome P450 n=1 Tax=Armillaria borealis TaxID=47425 RepID=A0AA39N006_9AGAR|nr:cytochrome P450 [Armillaria borealis]